MTLYFNDIRRFGNVELVSNFNKLGINIIYYALNKPLKFKNWISLFINFNITIYDFLMNQKIIVGLGNYLSADILCNARIYPLRIVKTLTDDELEQLRISTHEIILKSYQSNGLTIRNYVTPNNDKGVYKTLVYQQKFVDGYKVSTLKHHGRTIYYVPYYQPI